MPRSGSSAVHGVNPNLKNNMLYWTLMCWIRMVDLLLVGGVVGAV